jgi:hypothetical protein
VICSCKLNVFRRWALVHRSSSQEHSGPWIVLIIEVSLRNLRGIIGRKKELNAGWNCIAQSSCTYGVEFRLDTGREGRPCKSNVPNVTIA